MARRGGPYRSGLEQCLSYVSAQPMPADHLHPSFYQNHFYITHPEKGSPAEEVGLENTKYGLLRVLGVDGSNFGWNTDALVFHLTQSPTVTVQTIKLPVFFSPSYKTYTVKNRRVDTPPDPADAV